VPVVSQERIALRRAVATAACSALIVFLIHGMPPGDSPANRISWLRHHFSQDLFARRLAGSGGAFDRPYLLFLESARRALPATASGIAIHVPRASDTHVSLAEYQFAPIPVLVSPARVPRGWSAAVYGDWRPPGWRVISLVPGGALIGPVP
jgi:hypothetical protein